MSPRILIVEGEPLLSSSLGTVLSRAKYHVIIVNRGAEALASLHSSLFDLAIIALRLPDMYGLDLLPRLRQAAPQMKTLVFSTDGREATIRSALELGAQAFLIKPIEPDVLIQVLQAISQNQNLPETVNIRSRITE